MSTHDQDQELRRLFGRLRAADNQLHRGFGVLSAPASNRRRIFGSPVARAALIAAALLVVTRIGIAVSDVIEGDAPGGSLEQPVIDLRAEVWTAPTDFLLHTPGAEVLQGVPSFTVPAIMPSRELESGDTAIKRRNDS